MKLSLFDLTGKSALITGSTKGIGRAIAEELAAHGAHVVVSSRRQHACEEVAQGICDNGGKATPIACNVSNKDELEQLVAGTREAFGQIDVLVCNAAVNPHYGSFQDISDDAYRKILEVNILSNHWLAQMVAPEMVERRDGSIIIVSSIGGFRANTTIGAYCVSKAADMQMARNLAAELGPSNVRVNCIAPGLVKTDFAKALWEDPETEAKRTAATPLRRLGEPRDIAGIAVYLAAPAGNWTTGQTFTVDGGVTIAGS